VGAPREQGVLLPFYLLCDVSASMEGEPLAAANSIVPQVADAIADNPILSDKVRFALIDFSDDARVVLPLCDIGEQTEAVRLRSRGATSYSAAFDKLRSQIEYDVRQLRADGFRVHRPAAFFLSDGEPTDEDEEWRAAFSRLVDYDKATSTGFKWHPTVIPFGVGGADVQVLQELRAPRSKSRLYMSADGADAALAIRQMAEILVSSILSSGSSLADGGSGIVLPAQEDVPGDVKVYDDDFLED